MLAITLCLLLATEAFSFFRHQTQRRLHLQYLSSMMLPEGIEVDIFERQSESKEYGFNEKVDFAKRLQSHDKAILFAVPGAFTPTW